MRYLVFLLFLPACIHYPPGFNSDAEYIAYLESENRALENKYLFESFRASKAKQDLENEKEKVSKIKTVLKSDLKNIVSDSMKKDVK